uniref:Uncharacterized protein n=1 Tax=Meloidogyne enterolobii TaxID=390850 RepID=A0A6V7UQE3_MELEN|nr:unnamed protein product [Meloidogyne enterolobii]
MKCFLYKEGNRLSGLPKFSKVSFQRYRIHQNIYQISKHLLNYGLCYIILQVFYQIFYLIFKKISQQLFKRIL